MSVIQLVSMVNQCLWFLVLQKFGALQKSLLKQREGVGRHISNSYQVKYLIYLLCVWAEPERQTVCGAFCVKLSASDDINNYFEAFCETSC